MGMFDSIILDEFTMLDEGKQAEEYKARKDKEKEENNKRTDIQKADRYKKKDFGDRLAKHATGKLDNDITMDRIDSENWRRKGKEKSNLTKNWKTAADASDRHLRRHPKTESALMLIAGYESEFAY